jgi:predicted lipid carrier protein YhbT
MGSQTAADTIERFFTSAVARATNDPMLHRAAGTCRFDVVGCGSWLVRADHGVLTVAEARGPSPADCTLTAREDDFLRMARGEQNPLTTFMRGRLQMTGQIPLAERFLHLFP